MFLLRGFVLYVGLIAGLFGIAHGAALLSARWLGAGRFRWFDGHPLATAGWRRVAVRIASSVAPGLATLLVLVSAHLTTGELVPTTSLDVVRSPSGADTRSERPWTHRFEHP